MYFAWEWLRTGVGQSNAVHDVKCKEEVTSCGECYTNSSRSFDDCWQFGVGMIEEKKR